MSETIHYYFWKMFLQQREKRLTKKYNAINICSNCWDKHIPDTIYPTYSSINLLTWTLTFYHCALCNDLTYLILMRPNTNLDNYCFLKKVCKKCILITNHLLVFEEKILHYKCLTCNSLTKYTEEEK